KFTDQFQKVAQRLRRVGGGQQASDAVPPFAGALRGSGFQIVVADTGMGVQDVDRRGLAQQRAQHPEQQRVLEAIGEVPGMEGMAIIHGGPSVSVSSGQRGRGAKSRLLVSPSRSRSIPVQATITALSVQSRTGGATS